eukprot:CAMPEP_0184696064 /NCGR_PEP_ID=MMETSP0313-20130426/3484_1 /TAXON_ID=2792 /ORGANISM="Porphyridium aerugineum, Strain SAG 1380-2" /LENGTH=385 /DNA_ID=CAMNT_0027154627 /DNA_START=424 /DNA_END=1581 /DNA_ORIENTATION=-
MKSFTHLIWEIDFGLKSMEHEMKGMWIQVLAVSMITGAVCTGMGSFLALYIAAKAGKSIAAANVLEKFQLLWIGIDQMLFSKDKKFKIEPALSLAEVEKMRKENKVAGLPARRIVFIRHGESDWNEVFNRGFGADFPGRLFMALKRELELLPTGDSVFFDSSISETGLQQAISMASKLKEIDREETSMLLHGNTKSRSNSIIVCSNLRRSIQTALVGLKHRLELTGEHVHVMTALQEVTFNVDGIALAHPGQSPDLSAHLLPYFPKNFDSTASLNNSMNSGNKSIDSNGSKRIHEFLQWAFEQYPTKQDPSSGLPTIVIAGGHSLYLRYLLKMLLPSDYDYAGKSKKLSNCGVLGFTVHQNQGNSRGSMYYIDPESISMISGSWS